MSSYSQSKVKITDLSNLIGSKVAFGTPEGNFEGMLMSVSFPTECVSFEYVFRLPSLVYLGTMQVLYSEITSFTIVEPTSQKLGFTKKLLEYDMNKNSTKHESRIVKIDTNKHFFNYLCADLKDQVPLYYSILNSITKAFYNAVNDLCSSNIVGVSLHGPKISRNGILTWLCMSTSECLYLFDVKQLGAQAFSKGLKKIFEDKKIAKVMHDCRKAADCLLHIFQTNINNVFDTQVADYLISMQTYTGKEIFRNVNSLDRCLVKYLGVPEQFLYNRKKCASFRDEIRFFNKRPICDEYQNVLIKSCMYLVLLKKVQEKDLLSPFEQSVELYLDVIRGASEPTAYRESADVKQTAPAYLLNSIKPVNFYDSSFLTDDFSGKMKNIVISEKTHEDSENVSD